MTAARSYAFPTELNRQHVKFYHHTDGREVVEFSNPTRLENVTVRYVTEADRQQFKEEYAAFLNSLIPISEGELPVDPKILRAEVKRLRQELKQKDAELADRNALLLALKSQMESTGVLLMPQIR